MKRHCFLCVFHLSGLFIYFFFCFVANFLFSPSPTSPPAVRARNVVVKFRMRPTARFTWWIRVIVVGPLKVIGYASRNRWTAEQIIIIIITSRHRATLIDKFYYHYIFFMLLRRTFSLYLSSSSMHYDSTRFRKIFSNPQRSRVNPSSSTGRWFLFIRLAYVCMIHTRPLVVVTGIVTCDIIQ